MNYFFANMMNTIMVFKFYATKNAEELKKVTKCDQRKSSITVYLGGMI